MTKSSVLIVEDDGILAIHLEDLLKRQGYQVLKTIPSGEEAVIAVGNLKPSIVLMDIELSGKMNGITAAEKIAETTGTPVIFLTGFSQDPILEEAKFAAPYGYLVKPVPERELTATIEMALFKHQLDHQVKVSESKYRSLIEQASDGIFLLNNEGDFIEVNSAGCEMFGYTREEMLKRNMQDFNEDITSLEHPSPLPESYKTTPIRMERRLVRKDGTLFDVEISGKVLEDGNLQGIVRDITERKLAQRQAEINENRLHILVDISHYKAKNTQDLLDYSLTKAIELTNSKIGYIYYYDEASRKFTLNTWSREVMKECTILEQQTEYQLEQTGFWGEAVRQRKPIMDNDFHSMHPLKKGYPDGHATLSKFLTVPVFVDNAIVAVVGVANKENNYNQSDILQLSLMMDSVWKMVERKKIQDQLSENEEKYRKLFENLVTGLALHEIILDADGKPVDYRFLEMNPAFEQMTGLAANKNIGKTIKELMPEIEPFWIETYGHVALTGNPTQFEHYAAPLSKYFEVLAYCPKPGQFATIFIDITRRKEEENSLQQSTEALNKAQAISHVGSWNWNIREDKLTWSDEMYRIFGVDKESFTGKLDDVIPLRIHPDDITKVNESNSSVVNEGKPIPMEYRVVLPDNSIRDVWAEAGEVKLDETGKAVNLSGIVQDITERKKEEDYHRSLENKFINIFQTTPDAISISTLKDGKILDVNEGYTKVFGFSPEEVIGKTSTELNIWPNPDDRKQLSQAMKRNGEITNLEIIFHKKSGSLINCLLSARTIDIDGEQCLISIAKDISEYKKAEEAIHLQSTALNAAANAIVITNLDGSIEWANTAFSQLSGYDISEAIGKNPRELLKSGKHQAEFYEKMWKTILSGEVWNGELINQRKDKTLYTEEMTITPISDSNGKISRFIAIKQDITERKQMVDSLRLSDEWSRFILEHANDGIHIDNSDDQILQVNSRFCEMMGYSQEELLKMRVSDLQAPEIRSTTNQIVISELNEYGNKPFEKLNLRSDGRRIPVEVSVAKVMTPKGEVFISLIRDITERKKAAEELKRRNDYLAALQETTFELISQLDLKLLLENLTKRTGQFMQTPWCFLNLLDPETGQMLPRVGKGATEDSMSFPVQPGEGVAGIIWQSGKPLIINDYDHWEGRIKGYKENEVNSVAGVPLISDNVVIGVLEMAYDPSSGKVFEPESLEILSQFARLATIAIKNAQLYSVIQKELDERKVAESALQESEQRFRQMFAEHNATMLLIDPLTGKIMDANAAASRFYGYSLEQLRSMQIGDINLLPKEKVNQAMKSILEENSDVLIFPHRLVNGEVRTVEVHSSPIEVNNKKILFSIIHDITDRQQAETQIQQQLEELRRWNSVTLGRETRVMELKHEVNELLKKVGSAPRYSFTQEPDNE